MSFLEETPKTQCSSKTDILLTRLPLGLKRSLHTNLEPPPTTGGLHLQPLPRPPPPLLEPARRHHKTRLRPAQALKRCLEGFRQFASYLEVPNDPKIVSFLVRSVRVKMMLPLQRELKRQGLSIIKNMSKIDSEKMLPINCVMWSAMAVSRHHSSQDGAKVDLLKNPKLDRSWNN